MKFQIPWKWRRNIGFFTLFLAFVFTAAWMRSLYVTDEWVVIQMNDGNDKIIRSTPMGITSYIREYPDIYAREMGRTDFIEILKWYSSYWNYIVPLFIVSILLLFSRPRPIPTSTDPPTETGTSQDAPIVPE